MTARVVRLDDRRPEQRRRDDQVFNTVNEVRADLSKPTQRTSKQRNRK
ncbi:hypothetical protein [Micromonospora sp. NPDC005174]